MFPQHENDIWPPAGKERKRSITKNPKIGGLPLIPIQHERNATQARKNIEVGYNFVVLVVASGISLWLHMAGCINYIIGFWCLATITL